MAWHTIERKTEQVLKLWLNTIEGNIIAGLQILTRFETTSVVMPCLMIHCDSAEVDGAEREKQLGNWWLDCTLELRTHADDTGAEAHDEYMGLICDALIATGLPADLNEVAYEMDWHCMLTTVLERTNEVEEHTHITRQRLRIYAMPSSA